jgi:hypothetical protein
MTQTRRFPRHLVMAAAMLCGVLLALAMHMLGRGLGLDLAGMWGADSAAGVPLRAALAWWLIATVAFIGGYAAATLMDGAATGHISRTMWQFLIGILVMVLAGAGQSAAAPSQVPTFAGVLAGVSALGLGAAMAFCGAHFATRA